jgi:hypothetical protein
LVGIRVNVEELLAQIAEPVAGLRAIGNQLELTARRSQPNRDAAQPHLN